MRSSSPPSERRRNLSTSSCRTRSLLGGRPAAVDPSAPACPRPSPRGRAVRRPLDLVAPWWGPPRPDPPRGPRRQPRRHRRAGGDPGAPLPARAQQRHPASGGHPSGAGGGAHCAIWRGWHVTALWCDAAWASAGRSCSGRMRWNPSAPWSSSRSAPEPVG